MNKETIDRMAGLAQTYSNDLYELEQKYNQCLERAERAEELNRKAAELLRSAGEILEEFHVYHQGFREEADQWFRDAGVEK